MAESRFEDSKNKPEDKLDPAGYVLVRTQRRNTKKGRDEQWANRKFNDAAVDNASAMAALAEQRTQSLIEQRMRLTAITIAISGGLLAYCLEHNLTVGGGEYAPSFVLAMTSIVSVVFTKQIGVAEVYYFNLSSSCRYIQREHFGLQNTHFDADDAYQSQIGSWPWLFDQHSYVPFMWLNFLIPALSAAILLR